MSKQSQPQTLIDHLINKFGYSCVDENIRGRGNFEYPSSKESAVQKSMAVDAIMEEIFKYLDEKYHLNVDEMSKEEVNLLSIFFPVWVDDFSVWDHPLFFTSLSTMLCFATIYRDGVLTRLTNYQEIKKLAYRKLSPTHLKE